MTLTPVVEQEAYCRNPHRGRESSCALVSRIASTHAAAESRSLESIDRKSQSK